MIKINLALKKSAALSAEAQPEKGTLFSTKAMSADVNLNELKEVPGLIWFFVLIAGYYGMDYALTAHMDRVRQNYDQQIQAVAAEEMEVKKRLQEITTFEKQKKELEENEKLVRTKLGVLEKLVSERGQVPAILLFLSQAVPENVWIQSATLTKTELTLRGRAVQTEDVYKFVDLLKERRAYFSDVPTPNINQVKEDKRELTSFDLVAKRVGG